MKKRISYALGVTCAAALLLGGCSSSSTYGKYMTLGEYKGLEVSKIKTEITDDDIEQEISYTLDDSTEYNEVDRAAEDGDMVNITYSSTMDGEDFDGGSGEDVDIQLGAGYLEGDILQDAESQIIGMKAGDTKEMDLTIPEDYYFDDTLAGQSIQVTLTVNTVSEVNRPELTDEFVASISDFDTVDAYKEDLKKTLEASAEENNEYMAGSDALTQVVENSTFKGYPDDLYNECKDLYDQTNQAYAEMLGLDVSDFEGTDEEIKAAVESMVYEDMVVTSIAEKEKITVSDDEYTQYVENNLDTYGMSSVEEFESTYSKESVMDELLREKVQKFLLDNAKVTEVSEDEYYQEYDEGETYSDEDVVDLSLDDEAETEIVDADTEAATEAASETGSATIIIGGISLGLMSTIASILIVAAAILISYFAAGGTTSILDATGGLPAVPARIPGAQDSPLVCTPPDILTGKLQPTGEVIAVIGSGMTGLETAEILSAPEKDNAVLVVEAAPRLAPGVYGSNRNAVTAVLDLNNAVCLTSRALTKVGTDRIYLTDPQTGEEYTYPCQRVVLALGTTPTKPYGEALETVCSRVFSVGDAAKSGMIWDAVHGGYRAAREL